MYLSKSVYSGIAIDPKKLGGETQVIFADEEVVLQPAKEKRSIICRFHCESGDVLSGVTLKLPNRTNNKGCLSLPEGSVTSSSHQREPGWGLQASLVPKPVPSLFLCMNMSEHWS